MCRPYGSEIRAHCSSAKLVCERQNLVAIYGREVIVRIRVDKTNGLAKAAGPGPIRDARRGVKVARWLRRRNKRGLSASADRVHLRNPLHAI
jgi:transposase